MIEDGDRLTRIDTRLDSIEGDVHKLRLLYEHHDTQIQRIAEVLVQHGAKLDEHGRLLLEIKAAVAPIKDRHDFVQRASHDHEARIVALEKHAGLS